MNLHAAENLLAERVSAAIEGVTPGLRLRAFRHGERICDLDVGATHEFYDLASLTKIIFTQQALMQALDRGLWQVQDMIADHLPLFGAHPTKVVDLLSHTSGMVWWKPLFEQIALETTRQEKRAGLLDQNWLRSAISRPVDGIQVALVKHPAAAIGQAFEHHHIDPVA